MPEIINASLGPTVYVFPIMQTAIKYKQINNYLKIEAQ